ncbi:hypothetical protein BH11PSE3_BH11PSE3_07020 [soil metagenome]
MSFNRIVLAGFLAVVALGTAMACGPDFPWQLLDNRDSTVSDRIELNFAYEAARLVSPPGDGRRAIETDRGSQPAMDEAVGAEQAEILSGAWRGLVESAPAGQLSAEQLTSRLAAARAAHDGDAVHASGHGLPIAVLDYIAGAVEFRAGRLDTAMVYFEAIDRLPPDQRRMRAVAAAYMQGRIHQQQGELEPARSDFQIARRAAEAGAPDPMGLAVASLGEEARLDLVEAELVEVPWPVPSRGLADEAAVGRLIADAVRLYAEQAARGSNMARLSLGEVARILLAQDEALKPAVLDPLVRRLIVAYVASLETDSWQERGSRDFTTLPRVIAAVLAQPAPPPGPDLDRLAALAYQGGRYDLAGRLVAASDRPLGLWVRAKLALRRGDRAAAVRDWTAAFGAAEQGDAAGLDPASRTRLRGELAVMRLSQGEYRDSLQLLFPVAGTYWGDVIYIAERVLTADELKAFVDGLPADRAATANVTDDGFWSGSFSPVTQLRELLARRLVREGRLDEALAYFPPALPGSPPEQRDGDRATVDDARAHRAALEASRPGRPFDWPWNRSARAEALFTAATMTRQQGMGLMGTEGPPDETVMAGAFSGGIGQESPQGTARLPSVLLGPDETQRFVASAPQPDVRFHYRGIAADRAEAAAELLPRRSQSYAAALCGVARYAIDSNDQPKADAIYRRYVATGAYQSWARDFGQACPAPDFEGARTFWRRRFTDAATQIAGSVRRHIVWLFAAALLLAAAAWGTRRLLVRGG